MKRHVLGWICRTFNVVPRALYDDSSQRANKYLFQHLRDDAEIARLRRESAEIHDQYARLRIDFRQHALKCALNDVQQIEKKYGSEPELRSNHARLEDQKKAKAA